jgi:hypothetical protein
MFVKALLGAAAWIAAGLASPAAALQEDGIPPSFARAIADATVEELADGAEDRLVFFSGAGAGTRIHAIGVLPRGEDWIDPPEGTSAMLRTRARNAPGIQAQDIAFVRRTGTVVYVAPEGRGPLVELRRNGEAVEMREIDRGGRIGAWGPASPSVGRR